MLPELPIALLRAVGAENIPHHRQSLFDHLIGTYRLLNAAHAPEHVCLAGLLHSCYGTVHFSLPLFDISDRERLQTLIGHHAERLAYLFCALDRRHLPTLAVTTFDRLTGEDIQITKADHLGLLQVEIANRLDQQMEGLKEQQKLHSLLSAVGRIAPDALAPMQAILATRLCNSS
ncbi:DUF6817 domain-containing protein [Paraburkholderia tropica]|uniref:DUF6817 domain-containing protein n=1 Tax=Paraburkholderia tropica TaxID=92647 RepID=UPI001F46564D|nr:hypothetical protein [Paraburkholderia tropica]